MILRVYAVMDSAVGAYLPPLVFRSDEEATRAFADACTTQGQFVKHAADYSLWYLGTFNDATGVVENNAIGPLLCVSGVNVNKLEVQNGPVVSQG